MRAFAEAYPQFVQAGLAQIETSKTGVDKNAFMQAKLAQITWYQEKGGQPY